MSFEQHIKDYYRERLGGIYLIRDFGFAAYRIRDGVLYFEDFYVVAGSGFRATFGLMRDIIDIARSAECRYIVGFNDPTLSDYGRINKLHIYFKMYNSNQLDGHREMWVRDL